MDVVVVGGGIVGLASAHYLAERGADVVLCEKGSLGNESTARSAGGIRCQFSTPVNVRLSRESRAVWDDFEDRFGVDIAYRKSGYLFLARGEETAAQFRENVAMQNDLGVDSVVLDPEDAVDVCPGLEPEHFVAATYHDEDGFADPNLAVQGYAAGAREAGADVRTNTAVTDVVVEERGGDRVVTGVETDEETLDADFVVNAAGAWAADLAAMAGVDLPIEPHRRQAAVVDPTRAVSEQVPLTIDLEEGVYFRPEREGAAIVGGHFGGDDPAVDPDRYTRSMDIDWAAEAVERAAAYTTYFDGESRIKRGWAGLYGLTPDHHAILEESTPGLVTAAGFSGHGFQHAPATGQLVAEYCFDGEFRLTDVSALSGDRFDRGSEVDERNVV
ncbi:NAD(P)/FAD-dependent oxidoreductase [Halobacterium yunchengense]|uniref:NAD(P)/FAD-dependent oxidoreductase n=1 Tax=Halobacterium yunchengense TaxID=3108497 RepID=UPI00300A8647